LWVYSFIPHRDLYKSFHYYSPQKPSGKPEGFCGYRLRNASYRRISKWGCGPLPRLSGTAQPEKSFFTGKAGKKTYFILFHPLRRAKFCEAISTPRRVSPSQRRKKIKYVFRRDMCVPENTSRPSSVPKGRAQRGASPFPKTLLLGNLKSGLSNKTGLAIFSMPDLWYLISIDRIAVGFI
jgi:hypothetical protein